MLLYLLASVLIVAHGQEVSPYNRPTICESSLVDFFTQNKYSYDEVLESLDGKTFVKTLTSYSAKDCPKCIYYTFDFENNTLNYTETFTLPCGTVDVYTNINEFVYHCDYLEVDGSRFYFKLFNGGIIDYYCEPDIGQSESGRKYIASVAAEYESYYTPCTQSSLQVYSLTYRALGFEPYYVSGSCCFGPPRIFVEDEVNLECLFDIKTLHEVCQVENCHCKRSYLPCV